MISVFLRAAIVFAGFFVGRLTARKLSFIPWFERKCSQSNESKYEKVWSVNQRVASEYVEHKKAEQKNEPEKY